MAFRVGNFRRIDRGDFPDPPEGEWFDRLLRSFNEQIQSLTILAQGRISEANEDSDVLTLELTHGVAQEFNFRLHGPPAELAVQWAATGVDSLFWEQVAEDRARVTIRFVGAPTGAQEVRLRLRGS